MKTRRSWVDAVAGDYKISPDAGTSTRRRLNARQPSSGTTKRSQEAAESSEPIITAAPKTALQDHIGVGCYITRPVRY